VPAGAAPWEGRHKARARGRPLAISSPDREIAKRRIAANAFLGAMCDFLESAGQLVLLGFLDQRSGIANPAQSKSMGAKREKAHRRKRRWAFRILKSV
jgi:hypothetical protein